MRSVGRHLVVTGAGGFIGGHVVANALKSGCSVTAYARANAFELKSYLGSDVVAADILVDDLSFPSADLLIHCATANDVVSRDFEAGLLLSALGTRRVLEAAVSANISKIILLSTFQVFGTNASGKISDRNLPKLQSPYSLNHFFAEEVGRYFSSKYGIDVIAVRPSNIVGLPPHPLADRSNLVPHCFVKDALALGKVVLKSSGQQVRNFIAVKDLASLLTSIRIFNGEGFRVATVGGGANITIRQVAEMVAQVYAELVHSSLGLDFGPLAVGEDNTFEIERPYLETKEKFSRARMRELIVKLFELEMGKSDGRVI